MAEIQIGEPAVREVSYQAKIGQPGVSFIAVQILYAIGGGNSRLALEKLYKTESDRNIRSLIRTELDGWTKAGTLLPTQAGP